MTLAHPLPAVEDIVPLGALSFIADIPGRPRVQRGESSWTIALECAILLLGEVAEDEIVVVVGAHELHAVRRDERAVAFTVRRVRCRARAWLLSAWSRRFRPRGRVMH